MAEPRLSESAPGLTLGLGPGPGGSVERTGAGPSMKARARIMVGLAFALALPALLLGSLRAAVASDDVRVFTAVQGVADSTRGLELRVQAARTALVAFEAEPSVDTGRRLGAALDGVGRAVSDLDELLRTLREEPRFAEELDSQREEQGQEALLASTSPLAQIQSAVGRIRRNVDPLLEARGRESDTQALRRAHAALETLAKDAATLARQAGNLTRERAARAESSVSLVGRDQIVLFLLLLFAAPLFLGAAPGWMIAPLVRLRGVAQRIEKGRVRELIPSGNDEVADVTRALRSTLRKLDEKDHLQRSKLFELRRLLRATMAPVSEPIVILGAGGKVNYANGAAAELLGREQHHIENNPFDELMHSPELQDAIQRARDGDVEEGGLDVIVETDVRVERLHANLTPVRNQEGVVTRVVVVFRK